MKFEEKLVKLRKQRGMSQEELADELNVSRQAVSRWELGTTLPDALNLLAISDMFGVSIDYLLHDDFESDDDIPIVIEIKKENWNKTRVTNVLLLVTSILWFLCGVCNLISAVFNVLADNMAMGIAHIGLMVANMLLGVMFLVRYVKQTKRI